MGIFSDILLTVDYDRTLTAPDSTIPQRNIEAIQYFIDNGGAFTVNTGRSMPMAKAFLGKVPVNAPLLLYNGSAAYDPTTDQLSFVHVLPFLTGMRLSASSATTVHMSAPMLPSVPTL